MTQVSLLECFDLPLPVVESDGPSPDWTAGHLAGFTEGRALAVEEQGQFSAEIVQSLADMSFGYTEARGHLLLSLRPLFAVLMDRFLPALVREGFAAQLSDQLREVAANDLMTPIDLCVHPENIAGLKDVIRQAGMPINLRGDPKLGRGQAQFSSPEVQTMLDLDEMLDAARAVLSAIFDVQESGIRHG